MRRTFLFTLSLFLTGFCVAQKKFWKFETEQTVPKLNTPQLVIPKIYRTFSLPFDQYKTVLRTAPKEFETSIDNGLEIELPYPDNSFKKFKIVETRMMADGLATQFPEIKTYIGQGIDEPTATVRIDYTYQGFHACVISPEGALFIDPYQKANTNLYITYFAKDYENPLKQAFGCKLADGNHISATSSARPLSIDAPLTGSCIGAQLKTYRVAISCTGEYADSVCPAGNVTVANTMSAIVTTMNRVNGVYQKELDIKLVLVAANASIVYVNPATDPYTGNDDALTLINQSQSNITSVIGTANFDVGHTFSTGSGGLADQGAACYSSSKARGVSGNPHPVGDPYDIDYVAHEIGHEFGAAHPFESEMGNCGGPNRITLSAYEPGSGTTIMAYAGICGSDNIQPNSDPYFHTKSFDEIVAYTTSGIGSTCGIVTSTGNHPPVVMMPVSGIKIPKGTPFTLTGGATDIDGDALTYSWEEWDISNQDNGSAWNSGANSTVRPLFRARIPKTSGSRTFPDMAVILANYPANPPSVMDGLKGETLPQVARDIKFRLVARDNKASGGGVATGGDGCSSSAPFKLIVTNDGPFTVTAPNTAVNWLGGSTKTVTWSVANTNNVAGINAQNVDILMSIDGGNTYPLTVLANTPNDGTETIRVPNIPTNATIRFMVRASDNIFFDISNENFTVTFNDTLLQFAARPSRPSITLTWTAVTELNAKGFEVWRSEGNSNNFIKIGFVDVAGITSSTNNYTLIDNDVQPGVDYYYRLEQVYLNNTSGFSGIKRAKIDEDGKFVLSLQPQPFNKNAVLFIDGLEPKNFTLIISDAIGRIIERKEVTNTEADRTIPVDLNNQASGVYFIRITQDNIHRTLRAVKL